jgi:AraC family transcriptional regulator
MATPKRLLDQSRLEEDSTLPVQMIFKKIVQWEGVKVGHYRIEPGQIPTRTIRTHDVFVPLFGAVTIEGHESNGSATLRRRTVGEISVTPAGSSYSAIWEEELEYLSVYFTEDYLKRATIDFEDNRNAQLVLSCGPRDPLVRSIAQALAEELDSEQPAGKLYAESLVNTLAVHLMRHYSTDAIVPDLQFGGLPLNKLRRVTDFIEENLDQDLELAALAQVAELSPYHFARSFKQSVGLPPIQFLMERRVERAKQLLTDSDIPLSEVALNVGFKNQSHFTTLFRKFTEITPKVWRNSRIR